ncbi:quaternary ammonium compound efflux SMR transporter SugE [Kiloniella laminariae]|uniref:Guanidinium exporter n=1 Tax=Kiloniella laminariae TaxID=454162 RepID=A0ABT4LG78_9PROT|nr:quaternary ammonium compound efflux SMR transporter SugE [Kiloniella laminariae]MCZ4279945.1 quaternary ammonium compound efflux SMR transporter SugE [Kiloniella laminariae]
MAWAYLILAGLFECGWAIGLKYADGWTRLVPSLLTVAAMAVSFWLLSVAMKSIPVGTAYAVWTGIGTIGVAVLGMILFDEPRDIMRILCLLMIVAGIAGLKIFSPA